jgi:uncharacterized GH25 family protein
VESFNMCDSLRFWRRCVLPVVALLVVASGASLAAHDMWIEPTTFMTNGSKVLGVRLRVGQDVLGDPLPRDPALIDQFVIVDAAGRRPIVGQDGADPAGLLRVGASGLSVLGYFSRPSPVSLTAEKFNQYLVEEGLDAVAAERARRHATGAPAHEVFTRCAKSLVSSGKASVEDHDRALGFTLELIAERNPYALGAHDELPVQLRYRGQPLAGALVVAMNRANPAAKVSARTDATGHVRLRLPQQGMWLVKAVHMIPAPAGTDAEWASFWASLTFELKDGGASVGSR